MNTEIDLLEEPKTPCEVLRMFTQVRDWITASAEEGTPRCLVAGPAGPTTLSRIGASLRMCPIQRDTLVVSTSGSAGEKPSLVKLSSEALVASALATHQALGGSGRWVLALPVEHIAGLQVLIRSAVAGNPPLVTSGWPRFRPTDIAAAVIEHLESEDPSPLYISLVSAQLRAILDCEDEVVRLCANFTAILVGGGLVDAGLLQRARDVGLNPVVTYGMTETSGGCVYDGFALAGASYRIEEDSGRVLLGGKMLMDGYIDDPSPWVYIDDQRWLRTNDLGERGAKGALNILGRSDDIINSGGNKVSLGLVGELLSQDSVVADAACVAVDSERWGQNVAALVVLRSSEQGTADKFDDVADRLFDLVKDGLGTAAAPRFMVLTEAIPRTSLGKLSRAAAREQVEQAIRQNRAWQR